MKGIWLLSWRHAVHHRAPTLTLVLCIAVSILLPLATSVLVSDYERELSARADATPLVAGARGSRLDLTLAALFFRAGALPPIPYAELAELGRDGLGLAIPLHVRFTARGRPIVATSPEYHELRGLVALRGTLPLVIGDVALGATVARELALGPGDALFSDPEELYDISKPPALKLRVCGVLAERGTPDDGAVFVDVKTAWILEGLAHGHQDVAKGVDEELVLGRAEGDVVLSEAFLEYAEVSPENIGSFHVHGDVARLPLSAVLIVPRDAKAATLLKARANLSRDWQIVSPREVVGELLGLVFRVKRFLDAFSGALAANTALMTGLVLLLSIRLRAAEMETLRRIGCSRSAALRLHLFELALVLGASLAVALLGLFLGRALLPDLVQTL